ncbi:MAG TPA: uracil-DNA glycosylase [Candidatus Aquicultor sp.]|jgi:DNA polymerase
MAKPSDNKAIRDVIADIEACANCRDLAGVSDVPVFPRGNPNAPGVIVGEGPGEQEEREQQPFVGASGRLLQSTLEGLGFDVARDFYITNVVKHRAFEPLPSGKRKNKPPTVKQINAERQFLERELEAVHPKLIVTLGAKASRWFLGKDFKLTQDHGKFYRWHAIPVLPTFHPAAVLRAYSIGGGEGRLQEFARDLAKIREIIQPGKAA